MNRVPRMSLLLLSCLGPNGLGAQAVAQAPGSMDEENIKSRDTDYPVLNPHATHRLTLTGILPNTLSIRFLLYYTTSARPTADTAGDEKPCGSMVGLDVFRPFQMTEPLRIVQRANHFRATVTVDRYLPGRCGWHLEVIGFTVPNGVGASAESGFARVYDAKRDMPYLGDLYEGRIDEWCKKNPYPADPRRPERCASFASLQRISPVSPEVIARIPAAQQKKTPLFWIFPRTENIEIDFHDLDAMGRSSEVRP
jgi:hypothetical protein